jgi:hypothetical protein
MEHWTDLKRISAIGGLLWMFSFISGIVLSKIPSIAHNILAIDILDFLLLVLFAYLTISFYIQLPGPHVKDGTTIALGFILMYFLLDLLITIPLFGVPFQFYFTNWRLWTSFLVILITGVFLGGSCSLGDYRKV